MKNSRERNRITQAVVVSWTLLAVSAARAQESPRADIPALIAALAQADVQRARQASGQLAVQGAAAVPALLEALAGEDAQVADWSRVTLAAMAQNLRDGEPMIRQILALAQDPARPEGVRRFGVRWLGWTGARAAGPVLQTLFAQEPVLHLEIVQALGDLGDPGARPTLQAALGSEDRGVRMNAARALVRIGDPQGMPLLAGALHAERDSFAFWTLAWAVVTLDEAQATSVFQALFDSPEPAKRANAARLSIWLHRRELVPDVVAALQDAAPQVRSTACWALGQLEARAAIPALLDRLADEDNGVRGAAHGALKALTKQDFQFNPEAPADQRAAAVEKWRQWWRDSK